MSDANVLQAKGRANRIHARLLELGVAIKHTHVLEGVAAGENFSNWNRYHAYLERGMSGTEIGGGDQPLKDRNGVSDWRDEFISCDGKTTHRVFEIGPGGGKSSIFHCLAAHYSLDRRCLFIDCSGYSPAPSPDSLNVPLCVIDVEIDENGHILIPAPNFGSHSNQAVWVRVLADSCPAKLRKERLADVVNALSIPGQWRTLNDQMGGYPFDAVFIDDFHYLPPDSGKVTEALDRLDRNRVQIFIGTQSAGTKNLPGRFSVIADWSAERCSDAARVHRSAWRPIFYLEKFAESEEMLTSFNQPDIFPEMAALAVSLRIARKELQLPEGRAADIVMNVLNDEDRYYLARKKYESILQAFSAIGIEAKGLFLGVDHFRQLSGVSVDQLTISALKHMHYTLCDVERSESVLNTAGEVLRGELRISHEDIKSILGRVKVYSRLTM